MAHLIHVHDDTYIRLQRLKSSTRLTMAETVALAVEQYDTASSRPDGNTRVCATAARAAWTTPGADCAALAEWGKALGLAAAEWRGLRDEYGARLGWDDLVLIAERAQGKTLREPAAYLRRCITQALAGETSKPAAGGTPPSPAPAQPGLSVEEAMRRGL